MVSFTLHFRVDITLDSVLILTGRILVGVFTQESLAVTIRGDVNHSSACVIGTLSYLSTLTLCVAWKQPHRRFFLVRYRVCRHYVTRPNGILANTRIWTRWIFCQFVAKKWIRTSNLHDSETKLSEPKWKRQQRGQLELCKMQFHFSS